MTGDSRPRIGGEAYRCTCKRLNALCQCSTSASSSAIRASSSSTRLEPVDTLRTDWLEEDKELRSWPSFSRASSSPRRATRIRASASCFSVCKVKESFHQHVHHKKTVMPWTQYLGANKLRCQVRHVPIVAANATISTPFIVCRFDTTTAWASSGR